MNCVFNAVGEAACNGTLVVQMAATATAAVVLGSPIGWKGGAAYGAISVVTLIATSNLFGSTRGSDGIYRANAPLLSLALSVVAAWKLADICGVSMTLGSAAILSITTCFVSIAFGVLVSATAVQLVVSLFMCSIELTKRAKQNFLIKKRRGFSLLFSLEIGSNS